MAPNPFFSGRIPNDLHKRITEHLAETGDSKTQLLIKALSAYLNYPIQPNTLLSTSAEERISNLEQKVEALDKLLAGVITANQVVPDNKVDNILDNSDSKEQLVVLDIDNKTDNIPDNPATQESEPQNPVEENSLENDLEYVGKMTILDILEFERFRFEDKTKVKNKLRNANSTRNKTALIPPYTFKIVGKEPGNKGQLIYDVYGPKT